MLKKPSHFSVFRSCASFSASWRNQQNVEWRGMEEGEWAHKEKDGAPPRNRSFILSLVETSPSSEKHYKRRRRSPSRLSPPKCQVREKGQKGRKKPSKGKSQFAERGRRRRRRRRFFNFRQCRSSASRSCCSSRVSRFQGIAANDLAARQSPHPSAPRIFLLTRGCPWLFM